MSSSGSSQMSRPYDHSIEPISGFRNQAFKAWHAHCFVHRPVHMESKFRWDAVPYNVFQNLEWRGWTDHLTSISPCRPAMVREFYSSLIPINEGRCHVFLRGKVIIISPEYLAQFMNTREEPWFQCPWSPPSIPSFHEVHAALTLPHTPVHPRLIFVKDLHTCPRYMDVIARLNICPSPHTESFGHHHGAIVMAMCNPNMLVCLPTLMFRLICKAAASRDPENELPFGSLITRLCLANHVPRKRGEVVTENCQVLNSTSFLFSESLSEERAREEADASDEEESDEDGLPPGFFPGSCSGGF